MNYYLLIVLLFSFLGCGLEVEEDAITSSRNITRKAVNSVSSNGKSCTIDLEVTILGSTNSSTECYEADNMDDNVCEGVKDLLDFALMFYDSNTTKTFSEQPCPLANSFGQCNDGTFLKRFYEGSASEQEDACEEPQQVYDDNNNPVENEYEISSEWLAD